MAVGVCLIGFGAVLTAWPGQSAEPDRNVVRKQCSERKGGEEDEEETRGLLEQRGERGGAGGAGEKGESTLEESMMTMRISVVRRP